MLLSSIAVVVGLFLLAYAADQFVLGAARVALLKSVPALVVGIVIVGFGTSAPELLVSTLAASRGEAEIAVGNIVGSNTVNLTMLLGIGALLLPLAVDSRTVRREGPITLGAVILFGILVQNGITRIEAVILLVVLVGALSMVFRRGTNGGDEVGADVIELADPADHRLSVEIVRTLLGLAGTIGGAQLLLGGATDIADRSGLSSGFVGATLVAVGTSLPELVTVIQSARRGESDLIVGNLLGSNMFNALAVGGVAGLVGPFSIDAPKLTTVGAGAACAVALLVLGFMRTGHVVSRREGAFLVLVYLAIVPFLA